MLALAAVQSLDGTKPNTNPKTNPISNTNPNQLFYAFFEHRPMIFKLSCGSIIIRVSVNSSHGQLVTGQLVIRSTHQYLFLQLVSLCISIEVHRVSEKKHPLILLAIS